MADNRNLENLDAEIQAGVIAIKARMTELAATIYEQDATIVALLQETPTTPAFLQWAGDIQNAIRAFYARQAYRQ